MIAYGLFCAACLALLYGWAEWFVACNRSGMAATMLGVGVVRVW